jgi:amidase
MIGAMSEHAPLSEDAAVWPAGRLAQAIRNKELGSRELLELYLDRIDRLNATVNAVVTFDADRARAAADEADEATARSESTGPLHGLPVTIKDAIETAGIRSTGGATELTDHVPHEDALAVARLKGAGAIVFGKTNLPRWSGDLQSYNDIFGTTNNPWATDRVPGGSSGGAATAVACGFTSFELGTDIGGSVRIPSHFCGTFGLKPSFGVVPQRGYLDQVGGGTTDADINVFGPIARSADDLDLLLDVLAGPLPDQAPAWRLDLPAARGTSLADYRIGVWFEEPRCTIDTEYLAVLRSTVDRLTAAGAKVEEAHPAVDFSAQVDLFTNMISAAISPSAPPEIAELMAGSHLAWLQRDGERNRFRAAWADWFTTYDVLLCPVTPTPAFPHDQSDDFYSRTLTINGEQRSYLDNVCWTGLIGIVGLPSAVPPLGRTASGLPVGVQVVTSFLHDHDAVRVAGLIADVAGGYQTPPGF